MPNPARRRRYPSDTTVAEWALLEPLLPVPACQTKTGGHPEKWPRRQIVDAIRYITDNGAKWRALPSDFPPWETDWPSASLHASILGGSSDAPARR